jgi:chemotaxis protein CheX
MTARIQLQERLGLSDAEPLANRLRAVRGDDITIDASQVLHIGTLCQQVLLSASSEWQGAGHNIKILNPSDACIEQMALCGLSPEIIEEGAK